MLYASHKCGLQRASTARADNRANPGCRHLQSRKEDPFIPFSRTLSRDRVSGVSDFRLTEIDFPLDGLGPIRAPCCPFLTALLSAPLLHMFPDPARRRPLPALRLEMFPEPTKSSHLIKNKGQILLKQTAVPPPPVRFHP